MVRRLVVALTLVLSVTGCTPAEVTAFGSLSSDWQKLTSGPAVTAPGVKVEAGAASKPKLPWANACDPSQRSGFGGVKPWMASVAHHIQDKFHVKTVYGVESGSVPGSQHPLGEAADFMIDGDLALGDRIAADILANWRDYDALYVIFRQRINEGNGWMLMEDRGSPNANHFTHVHLSVKAQPTAGLAC